MKIRSSSFLLLLFLFSCMSTKDSFVVNDHKVSLSYPPGTTHIDDNLYADLTEITNIDYLEYLYWTLKIFGHNSEEYKSTLIDSNVWKGLGLKQTNDFVKYYFRHPNYSNFPVVGISYEQAKAYAKWRSDRVYEYLLIKNKIIAPNPNQDDYNYFSIENYFAGEYGEYIPDTTIPVPRYRLPTAEEWEKMAAAGYDQNEYPLGYDTLKGKFKRLLKKNKFIFNTREFSDYYSTDSVKVFMGNVYSFKPNKYGIYNAIGNVAELTSNEGVAKGGSWYHPLEMANINNSIAYTRPANWLGFRCVCSWEFSGQRE